MDVTGGVEGVGVGVRGWGRGSQQNTNPGSSARGAMAPRSSAPRGWGGRCGAGGGCRGGTDSSSDAPHVHVRRQARAARLPGAPRTRLLDGDVGEVDELVAQLLKLKAAAVGHARLRGAGRMRGFMEHGSRGRGGGGEGREGMLASRVEQCRTAYWTQGAAAAHTCAELLEEAVDTAAPFTPPPHAHTTHAQPQRTRTNTHTLTSRSELYLTLQNRQKPRHDM